MVITSAQAVPVSAARTANVHSRSANEQQQQQQQQQQHARLGSQDDPLLAVEEDGDDVFSNPDTAEYEYRSDATGATSPAPNSPGPGSPTNRLSNQIAIVASSPSNDPFGTIKHAQDLHQHQSGVSGATSTNKPLSLGSLPQTSIAQLQQQLEHQQARLDTPRVQQTNSAIASTPTRNSPRPTFGRAISASGATMQTMASTMHSTHSASGHRVGPTTPRMGGHAPSHSASHLSLPHNQLPSAHGLPTDPKEASTLSKLFAHPPAQSPAEELSAFMFSPVDPLHSRSPGSMSASGFGNSASNRRLSRPTTRPPSPDRFASPNRKPFNRASAGAMGLGLSPKVGGGLMDDVSASPFENGSSIFERDIEHRDATHILSKQEAIDVAIPAVLDDAVEAIHSDAADQLEIVAPHAILPPLALSAQALNAHSNSQIRLTQQQGESEQQQQQPLQKSVKGFSSASSPHMSPSPPLSNAGASEPPPGSMAAQIAERLSGGNKAAGTAATAAGQAGLPSSTSISNQEDGAGSPSRHRRPNSDVSMSSSSSMRSRSPQAPLAIGVQQVLAANSTASQGPVAARSVSVGTQSVVNNTGRSDSQTASGAPWSSGTSRAVLPTATALPALPLPNPYRTNSPSTAAMLLPDVTMPMLPSVSMDGAVMPTSESATLDASFGSLADVIASRPSTSQNSVTNSPSMRLRGLALEDHHHPNHHLGGFSIINEASPYTARSSPIVTNLASSNSNSATQSPISGRSEGGTKVSADKQEEYQAPSTNVTAKKRLSFFSYADIINQTPAEVLNFDEAVRQAESVSAATTSPIVNATIPISPSHSRFSHPHSPTTK